MNNKDVYSKIMEIKKQDAKRFACASIAVLYYELQNRLADRKKWLNGEKISKNFSPISESEIREMKERIKLCIKEKVQRFGITQTDIDNYNQDFGNTMRIKISYVSEIAQANYGHPMPNC